MWKLLLPCVLLVVWLAIPAVAGEKTVVLTSLDWPPYSGLELTDDGISAVIVREAFKVVGYKLEIRYRPWKRAIYEARTDKTVDGFFPEYYAEDRAAEFIFSESIGQSRLGFAERANQPVQWTNVLDLRRYRIGTVQGYVNCQKFDSLVEDGVMNVDTSVNDIINLRKAAGGRVDASVVDTKTFQYLMAVDSVLRLHRKKLRINDRLLKIHDLYVVFRKGDRGDRLTYLFNEGLQHVDVKAIQRAYLERLHNQ